MEGKINFYACSDTTGNKPHFKGFIEIGSEVCEFAVWPAKSGKGYSGRYKLENKPAEKAEEPPTVF